MKPRVKHNLKPRDEAQMMSNLCLVYTIYRLENVATPVLIDVGLSFQRQRYPWSAIPQVSRLAGPSCQPERDELLAHSNRR